MPSFEITTPISEDDFKRYFHVRWKLLRAPWGQPEGSETDDMEAVCIHAMAVSNDEIIGVARLQYNDADEAQIRYMAVDENARRCGVGRALMKALEDRAMQQGRSLVMLHAREPAVPFYLALGYEVIEASYLLFDEIQHFRMHKPLQ